MFANAMAGPPRLSMMSSFAPYIIAVASTAVAVGLTAALWPTNRGVIVGLYYPAVFIAAVYGNRLAAALAIALSAMATYFLFLSPDGGQFRDRAGVRAHHLLHRRAHWAPTSEDERDKPARKAKSSSGELINPWA